MTFSYTRWHFQWADGLSTVILNKISSLFFNNNRWYIKQDERSLLFADWQVTAQYLCLVTVTSFKLSIDWAIRFCEKDTMVIVTNKSSKIEFYRFIRQWRCSLFLSCSDGPQYSLSFILHNAIYFGFISLPLILRNSVKFDPSIIVIDLFPCLSRVETSISSALLGLNWSKYPLTPEW